MAFKLSPDYLVAGFVKSATNGKVISVRLRRVLTLVIIPIWIYGIIQVGISYVEAINAIPKYKAIQEYKKSPKYHKDVKRYEDANRRASIEYSYRDGRIVKETTREYNFDSEFWNYVGINDPSPYDDVDGLVNLVEIRQLWSLKQFYSLPIYFALLVLAPWLLLRLAFWIIDADKAKEKSL